MKKKRIVCALIFLVPLLVLFAFPRGPIVDLLQVESGPLAEPDLVVVMGGGFRPDGQLGRSTRERLDQLIAVYPTLPPDTFVLISEYAGGRNRMAQYLAKNSFPADMLVESDYVFDGETGGTVQNVADLFHVLGRQSGIRSVLIITSPYHQLRVRQVVDAYQDRLELEEKRRFAFHRFPDNSEIFTCGRFRFLRLAGRELTGIVIQRVFGVESL